MRNKKISLVLDNEFVSRSYLESSSLSSLNLEFDLELVLINQNLEFTGIRQSNLPKKAPLQFLQTMLSVSYWVKKKNISNSFRIRLLSLLHSRRYFYKSKNSGIRIPTLPVIIGFLLGYSKLGIPPWLIFAFSRHMTKYFVSSEPNLIIYVTSGGASSNSDVLSLIGRKLKIPTLVLVENWDNLTSKAVFNIQPDFLGVWGKKDLEASITLHDFSPNRVFEIGSPRVSKLITNHELNSAQPRKVLFAGGSTDFSFEIPWLKFAISLTSRLGEQLMYVPHPANYSSVQKFLATKNENIISSIPNEIVKLIEIKKGKSLPTLDFYTPIFQETWVTISPYSTMLLESLLLEIPAVGIDFKDSVKESEGWASKAYEHFHDLESFDLYSRITNFYEFEQVLLELFNLEKLRRDVSTNKTSSQNLFYDKSSTFEAKLRTLVHNILS